MQKIKLGDKIVEAIKKAGQEGLTRKEVTDALDAPSGSVRREVQTLMGEGRLVENGERDGSKILLVPVMSIECANPKGPVVPFEVTLCDLPPEKPAADLTGYPAEVRAQIEGCAGLDNHFFGGGAPEATAPTGCKECDGFGGGKDGQPCPQRNATWHIVLVGTNRRALDARQAETTNPGLTVIGALKKLANGEAFVAGDGYRHSGEVAEKALHKLESLAGMLERSEQECEQLKEELTAATTNIEEVKQERDELAKVAAGIAGQVQTAQLDQGGISRRFWSLVSRDQVNGCWLWTGEINTEGQGVFHVAGQGVRAKRLAIELTQGEALGKTQVGACEHSKLCVNPEHLGVRKAESEKTPAEKEDERQQELFPLACPREGCKERFKLKGDLTRHYQDAHSEAQVSP